MSWAAQLQGLTRYLPCGPGKHLVLNYRENQNWNKQTQQLVISTGKSEFSFDGDWGARQGLEMSGFTCCAFQHPAALGMALCHTGRCRPSCWPHRVQQGPVTILQSPHRENGPLHCWEWSCSTLHLSGVQDASPKNYIIVNVLYLKKIHCNFKIFFKSGWWHLDHSSLVLAKRNQCSQRQPWGLMLR